LSQKISISSSMSENVNNLISISEHYADLEPKNWPCDKNILVKCETLSQFNSWKKILF